MIRKIYKLLFVFALLFMLLPADRVSAQGVSDNSVYEQETQKPVRILLVGNSLTKFGTKEEARGLQYYIEIMAEESDKSVNVRTVAFGGASLQEYAEFCQGKEERKKEFDHVLKSQEWDYVILQELTKRYYKDYETKCVPAMEKLLEQINQQVPNAQVMLYVPRAYAKGNLSMEKMEAYMGAGGERLEKNFGVSRIPVGMHLYRASVKYPEIQLLDTDKKQHPTPEGAFLASSCVYQMIFNEPPKVTGKLLRSMHISKDMAQALIALWAEGISSEKAEVVLKKGEIYTMSVLVPVELGEQNICFVSMNKNVASVDAKTGKITALRGGTAIIKAETQEGWQTFCTLHVPYDRPKKLRAKIKLSVDADGNKYSTVVLKWKKQKGAKYEVYRAETKKGPYTLQETVEKNRFRDTNLQVGKTYYYKVRAIGEFGACASKQSKVRKVSVK